MQPWVQYCLSIELKFTYVRFIFSFVLPFLSSESHSTLFNILHNVPFHGLQNTLHDSFYHLLTSMILQNMINHSNMIYSTVSYDHPAIEWLSELVHGNHLVGKRMSTTCRWPAADDATMFMPCSEWSDALLLTAPCCATGTLLVSLSHTHNGMTAMYLSGNSAAYSRSLDWL